MNVIAHDFWMEVVVRFSNSVKRCEEVGAGFSSIEALFFSFFSCCGGVG